MIELKIVKEQYEQMPDEELIRFAKNESQHLTFDSFHLLMSEFELRNLDMEFLEYKEIDRLATVNSFLTAKKINRKLDLEHSVDKEYTEAIWNFIFDEKEKGETIYKIYNSILEKGINEDYAYMLVKSIEAKAKENFEIYDTEITTGWLLIIGGFFVFVLGLSGSLSGSFLLLGLFGFIHGILKVSESTLKGEKYQTIINIIQQEKDELDILYQ